jgi:hypothetical protein
MSLAHAEDFKQLQQGQPAPFAGTLLRPEAMATILSQNDADIAECKANGEHELEKQKIQCDLDVQKIQYNFDSYKSTNEAIMAEKNKELDKAYQLIKKQSSNKAPLWIVLGFVTGTATAYGTIYVYNHI